MDPNDVEALSRVLKALASPSRIRLLLALQQPRRLAEIDLVPSRAGPWGSEDRAVSRQAVRYQLRPLGEMGLVQELSDGEGDGDGRYVVNHAGLCEVTERLRALATIKPSVEVARETLELDSAGLPPRAHGPHLLLVRGVREGQVWPLVDAPPEGWLVGRAPEAEVRLDFDPYVSGSQARVVARDDRHLLVDLPSAKNRTLLNYHPMLRGAVAPLEPGDLISVGMSLLLYRHGSPRP